MLLLVVVKVIECCISVFYFVYIYFNKDPVILSPSYSP